MSAFVAGGPAHVEFWDAVDAYARERGAKNFHGTHIAIQRAVVRLERAAEAGAGEAAERLRGAISQAERRELDALAELDEAMALLRRWLSQHGDPAGDPCGVSRELLEETRAAVGATAKEPR